MHRITDDRLCYTFKICNRGLRSSGGPRRRKGREEACEEKSTELNKFYGELVKKERYEILANPTTPSNDDASLPHHSKGLAKGVLDFLECIRYYEQPDSDDDGEEMRRMGTRIGISRTVKKRKEESAQD